MLMRPSGRERLGHSCPHPEERWEPTSRGRSGWRRRRRPPWSRTACGSASARGRRWPISFRPWPGGVVASLCGHARPHTEAGGPAAGPAGGALHHRPSGHGHRRGRSDQPRGMAGQGRRRRPHQRETGGGDGRPLRGDRRLDQARGRPSSTGPAGIAGLRPGIHAATPGPGGACATFRPAPTGGSSPTSPAPSATRPTWPPGSRRRPAWSSTGSSPLSMVSTILVGRGRSVERIDLGRAPEPASTLPRLASDLSGPGSAG